MFVYFLILNCLLSTYGERIGSIVITLDSHHREHIAHSNFWKSLDGNEPPPFTQILSTDIGIKWVPKDEFNLQHTLEYTKSLESKGRFTLIIWPDHCIIGSNGQAVGTKINYTRNLYPNL